MLGQCTAVATLTRASIDAQCPRPLGPLPVHYPAWVAKPVDAPDSKSGMGNHVRVRVSPQAPEILASRALASVRPADDRLQQRSSCRGPLLRRAAGQATGRRSQRGCSQIARRLSVPERSQTTRRLLVRLSGPSGSPSASPHAVTPVQTFHRLASCRLQKHTRTGLLRIAPIICRGPAAATRPRPSLRAFHRRRRRSR